MPTRRYQVIADRTYGTTWYVVVCDGEPMARADTYRLACEMITRSVINDMYGAGDDPSSDELYDVDQECWALQE